MLQHRVRGDRSLLDESETDAPLIEAAGRGDAIGVEQLLQRGAEADVRDARGRTALHHAVAAGSAETAACLLAYGASHALRDGNGLTALDPENVSLEELHAIRQRYHRFRRSDERRSASSPSAERWARDLDRRGIVKIPGFVQPDELGVMRSEFESFVRSFRSKIARGVGRKRHYFEEEHWWPEERAFVTNNAFKHSEQLAKFSCRPEIVEAARLYLGRLPFIQRGVAMRYLAGPNTESDMFAWHHDLEDKRFKVMILLKDVGPDDQHMSYVCGSHVLFHPYRMFLENSCDLDYCRQQLGSVEIYDAIGNAGDVFLFDTNGAHRGIRRKTGRVRDVYLVEFNASAANVWGGDVAPGVVSEVRLQHDPFERLMAAEKKWDRPTAQRLPSWIASLPDVQAWL